MLSAFPPAFPFDSFTGNQFPAFEPCFPAPEFYEPAAFTSLVQEETVSQTHPANSGSDGTNRDTPTLTEPEQTNSKGLPSGSDEAGRFDPIVDERKRRRKESNRESARRSRLRKQRHLEDLRNLGGRLKVGNRELLNRLRWVLHQTRVVASKNDSLRSEAALLRRRLCDIRQTLLVRHHLMNPSAAWPCIINNAAPPLTADSFCNMQYLNK
ncbi:basic leucine zipper 1-like [Andrographis paniculata]|uniref:basic leucine zipper 1-like n=1 Tax=Andrographis paniculata TaxID=175694 RepID=UPI0021E94188|nr:basic leucine zipper 1-like [Andrographis paniculata]